MHKGKSHYTSDSSTKEMRGKLTRGKPLEIFIVKGESTIVITVLAKREVKMLLKSKYSHNLSLTFNDTHKLGARRWRGGK